MGPEWLNERLIKVSSTLVESPYKTSDGQDCESESLSAIRVKGKSYLVRSKYKNDNN